MEETIKKLLGSGIKSVEVLPAYQGGGDLHIARVVFDGEPKKPSRAAWIDAFKAYGKTAVVHFYKSKLPPKVSAPFTSTPAE